VPTASRSAWTAGGGGAVDHARHQRHRQIQGSSQACTWRSVIGHVVMSAAVGGRASASIFPRAGRLAGRTGRGHRAPTPRPEVLVPAAQQCKPPPQTTTASRAG
jgi:hypothetical protein